MKHHIICRIIGLILLLPPFIGVVLFIAALLGKMPHYSGFDTGTFWTGDLQSFGRGYDGSGGAGFTSPIPIYLGIMAIAGALLFSKDAPRSHRKQDHSGEL